MASRFYFSSLASADVLPAPDAAWDSPAINTCRCVVEKDGGIVGGCDADTVEIGFHNLLVLQAVTEPIAAQEISGTIKGQMLCAENDADQESRCQLVVRVISGDGAATRGVLLAAHSEALSSEWGLSFGNRKIPLASLSPAALSPVTAQDGDRLVFEMGAITSDPAERNEQVSMVRGAPPAVSDLPEDETESAMLVPWIELSANVAMQEEVPAGRIPGGLGVKLGLGF